MYNHHKVVVFTGKIGALRLVYNMTLGQRFVPSLRPLSVSIPLACVELFIIQRLLSVFSRWFYYL